MLNTRQHWVEVHVVRECATNSCTCTPPSDGEELPVDP